MIFSEYIQKLKQINWFENCGTENENFTVIHSIFEAYDIWNAAYCKLWDVQISDLETKALAVIGNDEIDRIFSEISEQMGELLWNGWSEFIQKRSLIEEAGLENEMLDMVKRDLAWAFIETHLSLDGFFTGLLTIYRKGYFPCSYDGEWPDGKFVVL